MGTISLCGAIENSELPKEPPEELAARNSHILCQEELTVYPLSIIAVAPEKTPIKAQDT